MYIYVRSRQLEGTFGDDPTIGAWPVSVLRIMRGWGMPPEESWPYVGDASLWPPKEEPPDIDRVARTNRIFAYQRVGSSQECKEALALDTPVFIAVEITSSWFDAPGGQIEMPRGDQKLIGGHAVILCGYDDAKRSFTLRNSWGVKWGDKGYGYLPYEYVDVLLQEAWIVIPHEDVATPHNGKGKFVAVDWRITSVLHDCLYGFEIRESPTDEREAWAFASAYDHHLNVEELFVRPRARGSGYASELLKQLRWLSEQLSLPLRLWVAHADYTAKGFQIIGNCVEKHGFTISSSDVRWASLKIEKGGVPFRDVATFGVPGIASRGRDRLPIWISEDIGWPSA